MFSEQSCERTKKKESQRDREKEKQRIDRETNREKEIE